MKKGVMLQQIGDCCRPNSIKYRLLSEDYDDTMVWLVTNRQQKTDPEVGFCYEGDGDD